METLANYLLESTDQKENWPYIEVHERNLDI
jgi:hypothetical protein